MNSKELDTEVNKIRNLQQYKGLSDDELKEVILARSVKDDLDVDTLFTDKEDKKFAKSLIRKYLTDYSFETIAEKNTLKQLIQLEVLNIKLQKQLNDYYSGTATKIRLDSLVNGIHNNIEEISSLKDRLGMNKAKREGEDGFSAIEILKKKFQIWRENNQLSRTIACGHCGKMLLLKIRTDVYETQKHPFFRDKVLYNTHLLKLLADGKITEEDVAKVLETSVFYVRWLLEQNPVARVPQKDPNQVEFKFNA